MSAPDDLIAGRYRLVRLIGRGGMGSVWEGRDERLDRPVALKLMAQHLGMAPADAEVANQRALREARITARIHHRYAVPVFDVVEHEGRPCLVMQFLPSMSLSKLISEEGPRSVAQTATFGAEVSSALLAAHEVGIVHRDIKPGNILVVNRETALITDFGISQAFGDATLTATGLVHGTPAYMAPEVALGGRATFASDVFSLGSTFYAAVEGQPPFGQDSNIIALLHRVASGQFTPPANAGPLTDLLLAMLAADPHNRPRMRQVAEAFAAIDSGVQPPPGGLTPTMVLPSATMQLPSPAVAPAAEPENPPTVPRHRDRVAEVPDWSVAPVVGPPAVRATPIPEEPRRRTGLWAGLAAFAVVLVLVVVAVAYARSHGGSLFGGTGSSAPASTATKAPTTRAPSPTSATPSPTASSASPTPTVSSASPSSASPSSSAPSSPASSSAPAGSRTAAELASAVTDYYALLPANAAGAWSRLTPAYQAATGGRKAYDKFWKSFQTVTTSDVVGREPNQAEATITYARKGGGTDRERRSFTLVDDGGVLKISNSSVIG